MGRFFIVLFLKDKIHGSNHNTDETRENSSWEAQCADEVALYVEICNQWEQHDRGPGIHAVEAERFFESFFKMFSDNKMRRNKCEYADKTAEFHDPCWEKCL